MEAPPKSSEYFLPDCRKFTEKSSGVCSPERQLVCTGAKTESSTVAIGSIRSWPRGCSSTANQTRSLVELSFCVFDDGLCAGACDRWKIPAKNRITNAAWVRRTAECMDWSRFLRRGVEF